eukprot:8864395-Lingulodinium_polyedra.AAC.1
MFVRVRAVVVKHLVAKEKAKRATEGKLYRGIKSLKDLPAYRVQNFLHVFSQVDGVFFVNNPHEECQWL